MSGRPDAATWLRDKAHSYHRDADTWQRDPTLLGLAAEDGLDWRAVYLTVADELRRCAQEVEQ